MFSWWCFIFGTLRVEILLKISKSFHLVGGWREGKSVIAICLWAKTEKLAACFYSGSFWTIKANTNHMLQFLYDLARRLKKLYALFMAIALRKDTALLRSHPTPFASVARRSYSWLNLIQRPRALTTPIAIERVNNRPQLVIYCRVLSHANVTHIKHRFQK